MKRYFNMIEVTLAIAVVGLGIAGIMSLFPIGLNSSRDAIGYNYASDISNRFITLIKQKAKANWAANIEVHDFIPDTYPDKHYTDKNWQDKRDVMYLVDKELKSGIYYHPASSTASIATKDDGAFAIRTPIEGELIDFAADINIWKTQISTPVYDGDWQNKIWGWDEAAAIHIEISWPIEKPFSEREVRHYYLELYNK